MKNCKIFICFLILIALSLSGCFFDNLKNDSDNNKGTSTSYTTGISTSDYSLSDDNPSYNVLKLTIIPKIDIDDFVINMELTDAEQNVLGIDIAKKDKVNKNEKYEFIFDANTTLSANK
ncbi:MAG: hypothetical protein IKA11_01930 [Clostridia bacterium]|nr:hypothetical protein [Clostridia bacterium]